MPPPRRTTSGGAPPAPPPPRKVPLRSLLRAASVACDLHTAEGLKALEAYLAGKTYISGDGITKDDIKVFAAVPTKPGAEFPNAARWYDTVAVATASRFPGKAAGVSPSSAPAAAAPATAMDVDDDDDLDLFGDETEEDKKAAAERAAAKPAKKKESGQGQSNSVATLGNYGQKPSSAKSVHLVGPKERIGQPVGSSTSKGSKQGKGAAEPKKWSGGMPRTVPLLSPGQSVLPTALGFIGFLCEICCSLYLKNTYVK